jgi:hypothetical protein
MSGKLGSADEGEVVSSDDVWPCDGHQAKRARGNVPIGNEGFMWLSGEIGVSTNEGGLYTDPHIPQDSLGVLRSPKESVRTC